MIRIGKNVLRALLALALASLPAPAQEVKVDPPPPDDGIEIVAGNGMAWEEDGMDVSFLTGNIRVRRGGLVVTAARAMVWSRRGSERPVEEIYAEGHVVLRRGDQQLRAERLYLNLEQDRAILLDFKARSASNQTEQAFFLAAREARMEAGRIEAEDITLSPCSFAVPHTQLEVRRATLVGRDPRPRERIPWDVFPYRSWTIQADNVYPELGGAPFFFFPGFSMGPWVRDFPLRSVQYGKSSRFGHSVLSEFGLKLREQDEEGKVRTWGEVTLEADWREKRGGAYGLDLQYDKPEFTGFVDSYFLYDQGRALDVGFERKLAPLTREERGRLRTYHRHTIDEHWRWELETSYVSDSSLLEEFFEKEFKEEKEPETAGYLRWTDGPFGAYLLDRHRLNDFQTQNELLPSLNASALTVPLLGGALDNLYVTERFDVSHLRRRFDEDHYAPSERTWRADASTELFFPWDLGPAQASPLVRQRSTYFGDDLEGQGEFRSLWTAGGRLTAQAHATRGNIAWEAIGLRGVRHVAEVEARYGRSFENTLDNDEVYPFDSVDRLDEFEEVALELRQRFLTRDEQGKAFEFLGATVTTEYYPDSDRDAATADPNNIVPPFNWVTLAPRSEFASRDWSNIYYDVLFQPRNILRLWGRGEYNPSSQLEEVSELGVSVNPWKGFQAFVLRTAVRGVTDATTAGGSLALTEKWSVSGSAQYDFRAREYVSEGLVVSRDCHDFLVEVVVERDTGRGESLYYVSVVPKFVSRDRMRSVGMGAD